ncbi:MAG: uridine kinase [Eubacteriales bacterium]
MVVYNRKFENDGDIRDFIEAREADFRSQVETVASLIAADKNIKIITLSGPSCAGKTTSSHILERELEEKYGMDSKIISIDDFFKDRDDIAKQEKPDYESILSIDFEYFKECVNNILSGNDTYLPRFDFTSGKRDDDYELYRPHKNGVVVFEGIQAMYPEITAILPANSVASVYIDILDDVYAYGSLFSRRDIRFYRRLVRDFKFRGASVSKTLFLWNDVIENEKKNIFPYSFGARYSINSSLLYEINVIKSYLINILSYEDGTEHIFDGIRQKFSSVPDISPEFVPKDSVFREFIG